MTSDEMFLFIILIVGIVVMLIILAGLCFYCKSYRSKPLKLKSTEETKSVSINPAADLSSVNSGHDSGAYLAINNSKLPETNLQIKRIGTGEILSSIPSSATQSQTSTIPSSTSQVSTESSNLPEGGSTSDTTSGISTATISPV